MSGVFRDRYVALFDGDPLDGTRLARVIADTVPEANQEARMEDFRADLKRRVAQRRSGILFYETSGEVTP